MSHAGDEHSGGPMDHGGSGQTDESMVRDEVCGMRFSAAAATATVDFAGKSYYFCSERCRRLFSEHPAWYVPVGP